MPEPWELCIPFDSESLDPSLPYFALFRASPASLIRFRVKAVSATPLMHESYEEWKEANCPSQARRLSALTAVPYTLKVTSMQTSESAVADQAAVEPEVEESVGLPAQWSIVDAWGEFDSLDFLRAVDLSTHSVVFHPQPRRLEDSSPSPSPFPSPNDVFNASASPSYPSASPTPSMSPSPSVTPSPSPSPQISLTNLLESAFSADTLALLPGMRPPSPPTPLITDRTPTSLKVVADIPVHASGCPIDRFRIFQGSPVSANQCVLTRRSPRQYQTHTHRFHKGGQPHTRM